MTFKSAYLRLTVYYVLIIMTISLTFSLIIYRASSKEIKRGLDRQWQTITDIPVNDFFQDPAFNFQQIGKKQLKESLSRLTAELIYLNLAILVLSSFGSYFFAKKTLEPIEDMVDAQNRFTADASHELKTPLAAMRSEIEVSLRDRDFNLASAIHLLTSNLEEISKLESLSNALLKLARYQNEVKTTFSQVDLQEVIVAAYEKIQSLADVKEIEFETDLKSTLIVGDEQSLAELFLIILDNAVKYSPPKSNVSISCYIEAKRAIVKIKDKGYGIKASDLPFIFNRFYRADTSRSKDKVAGYGLGLSIAKRIVELHQGTISVASQPAKGTEFTISLPISHDNSMQKIR